MSGSTPPEERGGGGTVSDQEQLRQSVARALTAGGFDDVCVLTAETADELLTPRRRGILQTLANNEFESQQALAKHLGHHPGNLARDLDALESAGIVTTDGDGRTKVPSLEHDTVIVEPLTASRS